MKDQNEIAESLTLIAGALHKLGTADALTSMGGLEMLSKEVKDGAERISGAIGDISDSIDEMSKSIDRLADVQNMAQAKEKRLLGCSRCWS